MCVVGHFFPSLDREGKSMWKFMPFLQEIYSAIQAMFKSMNLLIVTSNLWVWGHGSPKKKGRRVNISIVSFIGVYPRPTKNPKAPYNNPSVNEFVWRPMLPKYRKKSDSQRRRWRKKDVPYFLSIWNFRGPTLPWKSGLYSGLRETSSW